MAAENSRFHQQALSSQMMLMSNYYTHLGMNFDVNNSGVGGGGGGMLFSGNPTMINNNNTSSNSQSLRTSQYGSCSDSFLIDTVPGLKHDTGLAVEWTVEEQYKLDEGLMKFANEPRIMKYIKIASTLREKNVRDVALRCRWITRKRRKQEDYSLVKKLKDRKDKSAEMSSKSSASASLMSLAPYSLSMSHHGHGDVLPSGELLRTRRLLEENNHALNRISANLSTLKGSILDGGRGYACNPEEAFASNYQGTNGRIELLNTGITTVKHLVLLPSQKKVNTWWKSCSGSRKDGMFT